MNFEKTLNILVPYFRILQYEFKSNSTTRRSFIFSETSPKRTTCRKKPGRIRPQGIGSIWHLFRWRKPEKMQVCRDQSFQLNVQRSRLIRSESLESQSKECQFRRGMSGWRRFRMVQLRWLYDSKCKHLPRNPSTSIRIIQADQ